MAVAEGFEPSACPRSGRRNGCDLRNNIACDSLGLLWFVPKCAQNVPTGAPWPCGPGRRSATEMYLSGAATDYTKNTLRSKGRSPSSPGSFSTGIPNPNAGHRQDGPSYQARIVDHGYVTDRSRAVLPYVCPALHG
jgi:hypothetical protein